MKFDYMKLKGERVSHGYTQADVAKKLGMTRQAYAKRESGKADMSVDELSEIGSMFGLTPEETFRKFFKQVVH